MENQKNIPSLRFPEFSGAWEKKKFGEEIENNGYGPRFNGNDYSEFGNVKTIRGTDISLDGEILYNQVPLALLDENFIKNHILEDGDLVMITTADCGLTGVFRKQNIHFIPSAYAVKIRLKKTSNPFFLKYYFQTKLAKNQVESFVRKGTIGNLPGSDILKFILSFPTLPEQTKIANFLSSVDEKIQALKKKKDLLEQYKKGVMQKLFSQEIRFKDDDGKAFPDWEEKKLGEIAKITTGSSNRQDSILDGEFTFFDRSQDIRTSNRFLFDSEAIIVPGEGQEFIPKYFIGKFDLHQRTYAIMDFKGIDGKFIFYSIYFNSKHLNSHAVGSTVKSLRLPMFESMPINLPYIREQTKIANFLSAIDEKIKHNGDQIEKMEIWKKGLLQKMFVLLSEL